MVTILKRLLQGLPRSKKSINNRKESIIIGKSQNKDQEAKQMVAKKAVTTPTPVAPKSTVLGNPEISITIKTDEVDSFKRILEIAEKGFPDKNVYVLVQKLKKTV